MPSLVGSEMCIRDSYNVNHKPMAEGLELLPKTYAELKPKLGPPLPGDLGMAYLETIGEPEIVKPTKTRAKPTSLGDYAAPPIAPRYETVPAHPAPIIEKPSLFFELSGRASNIQPVKSADLGVDFLPQITTYPDIGSPPSAFSLSPVTTCLLYTSPSPRD